MQSDKGISGGRQDMKNLFDLSGKRAVVTGGTSGIGLAIVEAFAEAGARVLAVSENETACRETETALSIRGLAVSAYVCDVSKRKQVEELHAHAIEALGGLDILVANAGIEGPIGETGTYSEEAFDRLLAVNLKSVVWLSGMTARSMAESGGGSIILMSSLSGLRGNKMIGAYAMTKAALAQLARNLAVEWGSKNIRANAISPGLIRTPFSHKLMEDSAFMERRLKMTPLRRVGEPHEIAATAVFLASTGGAFITGQNIVVDGGTIVTDGG
jgi:NAD(P)-dependent dehydrogenase (short-subunit alcohol dehydrogenase family)